MGKRLRTLEKRRATQDGIPESAHYTALRQIHWPNHRFNWADIEALFIQSLETSQNTWELWNDLAAARLTAATEMDSGWMAVKALEAVEVALSHAPGQAEPLFNRALILGDLGLRQQEISAWERYLAVDSASPWAAEARARAISSARPTMRELWQRLQQEIGQEKRRKGRSPSQALKHHAPEAFFWIRDEIAPQWATAVLAQRTEESHRLERLINRWLPPLTRATDDTLLMESWQARLPLGAGTDVSSIARALVHYREGLDAYETHDFKRSRPSLEKASALFSQLEDPMAYWADFFVAICTFQDSISAGETALQRLLKRLEGRPYPILEGRTRWVLGTSFGRQNNLAGALKQYEIAHLLLSRSLGQRGGAFVELLLGEALDRQGYGREAFRLRRRAHRQLSRTGDLRRSHSALISTGRSVTRRGQLQAARAFFAEAVENAEQSGDAYAKVAVHQWRGRLLSLSGDRSHALEDFREAAVAAQELQDVSFRTSVEADLRLAEAESSLSRDSSASISDLNTACTKFAAEDDRLHLRRGLALLGQAKVHSGDLERGISDLWSAAELYSEALADPSTNPEPRFVAEAEELFRLLLELELEQRNNTTAALRAAALSRRVPPFGRFPSSAGLGFPIEIPSGQIILFFQEIRDRWVIFRLMESEVKVFQSETPARETTARAERLRQYVLSGEGLSTDAARSLRRSLYDDLLAPALPELEGNLLATDDLHPSLAVKHLVLIPDRGNAGLPFAALIDPSGHPLLNHFALSVAPNLDPIGRRPIMRSGGWLLVGNPSGAIASGRRLPDLPAARAEVENIHALHGAGSTLLLEGEATPRHFLDQISKHAYVHVAAHITFDSHQPFVSLLHLAPDYDGSTGILPTQDVLRIPLENIELAVISGCSSVRDESTLSRAPFGIGGSFLAAGAAEVIGAIGRVEDQASSRWMLELHRALLNGLPPVEALRIAQLVEIRRNEHSGDDSLAWAALRHLSRIRIVGR